MGKVVPVPTVARFLELLKGCRLLSADAFAKVEEQYKDATDPAVVARNLAKDNVLTKWQAGQLLHGFHALVVGKYKLLEQVSINETGRVYLAEHGQLGRKVALKLLAKQYTSNPENVTRFLSEARIAAAIDHRNILHVHDVAQEADRTFLVTEYVAGKCLNELKSEGPIAMERIVAIMQQLAAGIDTAHSKKVFHGGLRPSTVLLDTNGTVKIIDLGVASLADLTRTNQEESTEMSVDVLAFAAPERTDKQVAAAGDIYALGGILFFLLTGELPKLEWKTRDPAKSTTTVSEIYAYVKSKCPQTPVQLLKLCAVSMAPQVKDRPKSAADIVKVLEVIAGMKTPASSEPAKQSMLDTKNIATSATPTPTTTIPAVKTATTAAKSTTPVAKALPKAKPIAAPETPKLTATAKVATAKTVTAPNKIAAKIAPAVMEPVEEVGDYEVVEEAEDIAVEVAEDAADMPLVAVEENAGFGGFSIQTDSKPAPKTSPKPSATNAVSEPMATIPAAKSNLPLILGLSIGGGVLALAGIIGVVFMMSGGKGKPKEVAQVVKPEEAGPTEPTEPTESETEPEPMEKAPPKKSILDDNPPVIPVTPEPEPEKPTTPDTSEPTTPTPEPTPETPTPDPTPKPETPTDPVPKPAPTPPKQSLEKPFREIPAVAVLPGLGAKGNVPEDALKEKVYGKMYLAGAECFLELHGGDGAAKGKKEFILKAANNETSTTDYEIKLKSGPDSAAAPVIAKIFVGDEFKFQWQPAALETPDAPYLMNCVLALSAGKFAHEVRFREIQTVDPLLINSPPKPVTGKWNTDFLPDASRLRIEFIGVDGIEKHKFDKKEIACTADAAIVWIGKSTTPLGIKVTPSASRFLEMKGQFFIKTEGDDKEQPFKAKIVEQMLAAADNATQMIERELMQQTNAPQPADRKKQIEQQADMKRQEVAKKRNEWQGVGDAIVQLKAPASIHFRLIFETKEGKRIEIFTSKPAVPKA